MISLSLSLSVSIYFAGLFYVCGRFSNPSLYHFWSRSPRILQQSQSVFEETHFGSFLLLCVGALLSIITSHRGLIFFEERDGILRVCNVMCAQT